MENITSILSGTDVQSIANLLKKEREFDDIYDFICKRFEYIPLKFANKDIDWINKNPIEANQQFSVHVDGANGDTTIETPESLLEIYISVWDNILKYEKKEIPEDRPGRKPMISGPHYKYNLSWRKDSNIRGDFSGDVLISFPKFEVPENVSANYIKLFARLVYTIGNFMPAPKLKEGNSLNKIHGYCCYDQGLGQGGYERMDYFLLDISDNNSINKESYKKLLGSRYSMENFVKTFYLNCYLKNGKVLDLSFPTLDKTCEDKGDLEILRSENFVNYIINGCACIIARGNQLLMTQFLKKRQKMKFSLEEVIDLLNKLGYQNCVVETGIRKGARKETENETYKTIGWKNQKQGLDALKEELRNVKKVPEHFAYIKFYSDGSNGKKDSQIWALVVGKSNVNNPDLRFQIFATEEIYKEKIKNISDPKVIHTKLPGDLSKVFLHKDKYMWVTDKILVFWRNMDISENKNVSFMAFKAEADIGGLLGLFNS